MNSLFLFRDMREIEILVEVLEPKHKALPKLRQFAFKGIKKIHDIYFFDPLRTKKEALNGEFPKECFRLRSDGNLSEIAYKIDHHDAKGIWTYSDEYETRVKDFETALRIIEHLGLKKLIEMSTTRHEFKTKEYTIVLDDVENLGVFLEVEYGGRQKNVKKIRKDLRYFLDHINVKVSKELHAGKPELMLRKRLR